MAHYENMADKSKSRAWSLTTWVLTLNSGLLAFCIKFYTDKKDDPNFQTIEYACCSIGVLLSIFLCYMIYEQGKHLKSYWKVMDKILTENEALQEITGLKPESERIDYPAFCKWLMGLALMFSLGFVLLGIFFSGVGVNA